MTTPTARPIDWIREPTLDFGDEPAIVNPHGQFALDLDEPGETPGRRATFDAQTAEDFPPGTPVLVYAEWDREHGGGTYEPSRATALRRARNGYVTIREALGTTVDVFPRQLERAGASNPDTPVEPTNVPPPADGKADLPNSVPVATPSRLTTVWHCTSSLASHRCVRWATRKPRNLKCTYCGATLRAQTGVWGVCTWRGDGRYTLADADATYVVRSAAEKRAARTPDRVVRFISLDGRDAR